MLHYQVGNQFVPELRAAADAVRQGLCDIEGLSFEDNRYAVSVHYRNCDPAGIAAIEQYIDDVLLRFPHVKKTCGKMVFELRVSVEWHKGRAVEWLLEGTTFAGSDNVVIYLGDDITDEDVFVMLRSYPSAICGIVGAPPERKTAARFCLEDTQEVVVFLQVVLHALLDNA
eukprot:GHVR01152168.1.p1 GENE.GHVR01152168.1~~GHVR01152168.1.p1  ORF type:complete len:171 (+),score=26.73 GHVR01152168.1:621-1133(+)